MESDTKVTSEYSFKGLVKNGQLLPLCPITAYKCHKGWSSA